MKKNIEERNIIKMKNISIIGAGSWGTSIAKVIADIHPDSVVKLWAYEKEVVNSINNFHVNRVFLPGIELPRNIIASADIREAVEDCHILIFATPSKVLYDISLKVKKYIPSDVYIGYLTKGFCKIHNEILPISETLASVFTTHSDSVVAIYGPSHAEEVSKKFHTCLNVASHSKKAREVFMELLSNEYMECRGIEDIRGVDIGATLKNPAAVAAGMISMLPDCGDNLAGVLIVEALGEMIRLGKALDVNEETLFGIAGLGDLVTTALSDHSRNRRFGKDIAGQIMRTGKSLNLYDRVLMKFHPNHVLEKMSERLNYLAEGAYAIEPIIELAESHNISIPVYKSLYEILLNKRNPGLLIETVKNPDKFEEMVEQTKIHTTKKKRGMEKSRGTIFKKKILQNTTNKLLENSTFIDELFELREALIQDHSDNSNGSGKFITQFTDREYELFLRLDAGNPEKGLTNLCKFYLDDVSDNFNYTVHKFFMKYMKFVNFFKNLLRRRYNKGLLENSIKISGNFSKIEKINNSSNLIYVSTYRSYFDFAYINMAIDRYGLHIPRFCFERKVVDSRLKKFLLKLIGGYVIDSDRLGNPVYNEIIRNYLTILIEHGVHIVFFPEIRISRDGSMGKINREFLSMIMDALFKNTEEIALVPIELSYYKKPLIESGNFHKTLSLKNILDNRLQINFSKPLFASDFSNDNNLAGMAEKIDNSWKADSYVFPHYILCRILKDNNYKLTMEKANNLIIDFLQRFNLKDKYKPKEILKEGSNFIVKSKIGEIRNGEIIINKNEDVDYCSNLIN